MESCNSAGNSHASMPGVTQTFWENDILNKLRKIT